MRYGENICRQEYRGANAGNFSGINELDLLLGGLPRAIPAQPWRSFLRDLDEKLKATVELRWGLKAARISKKSPSPATA
jgi:hypothetical protein